MIEAELAPGGELHDVRDIASKCAENVARLAALYHLYQHGTEGSINIDLINSAIAIVTWHLSESRQFYAKLALPKEILQAITLDDWIVNYTKNNPSIDLSKRTIQQRGPNKLRSKTELDEALNMLIDHNRIRIVKSGRSEKIIINPFLLEDKEIL